MFWVLFCLPESSVALPANCFSQLYLVVSEFWATPLFCFSRISLLGEYLLPYWLQHLELFTQPSRQLCKDPGGAGKLSQQCQEIQGIFQSCVTGSSLSTIQWQIARGWLWSPHNSNNYVWLGLLIMEKLHCPSTPGLYKPLLRSCAVNLIYDRETPKLPHKIHGPPLPPTPAQIWQIRVPVTPNLVIIIMPFKKSRLT